MPNSLTTSQPLGQQYSIQTVNAGVIQIGIDVGGAGGVTSVFGRAGAVVAQAGDYTTSQVTNSSSLPGTTASDALNNTRANVQQFTASTSYALPTGPWSSFRIEGNGTGGGGGAGRRGTNVSTRGGGSGGGGGGHSVVEGPASMIVGGESIVIGAPGTGGPGQTADNTNGQTGTAGGDVTFGTIFRAGGGGGGTGAGTGATNGGLGGTGTTAGGVGGAGAAVVNSGAPGSSGSGGGGGGAGGGTNGSNVDFLASAGGTTAQGFTAAPGGAAGASGGGAGGNGTSVPATSLQGGAGGGGGGPNGAGGPGGTGGNGGNWGGGGGGGGASVNGSLSGAGGNGGAGILQVTLWR